MIKFKNINGDVFLAVGSVKRKSALNGEKSLSATITQGDDVLNKIDKGWSLEFDNESYVVTYFERNDNDNTVEIDAIHKFFWDITKSVLYATYSSSHVARFYLDEIFKDTGYTYALNFDPKAFEKENWGMKNKLSLFNNIISSIGAEFEINGTLISIFKNVGSDLSTIVRHGFNLSDMTLENDNANFATYAEGFGAYEDQENQKGSRLHVTYKSSLAKAFGKLHAEPVDDQRYTVKDNLLQAVKDKVDGSFAVSVKLSLYDLTAAGYPYKMANVGDWLLAVDENLDFKQKIRIISVDDEFAEDGTRISYTVTCGDVGVAKKYQDANASLSQKVQSAYDNAQAAKESAIQAVISSTGKNTNYRFDSVDEMNAFQGNEGDLAFVQIGDGQAMYVYTKMPDGSFKWVKRLDPDTGEQIAAGVEEAISTANKYTDELNEKQASEAATFQSEANVALSSAAAERTAFSSNAASMATSAATHADSMANSAATYAKEQAASALSSANSALTTAKSDLTTAIGQEISDRNKAVSAVNSQAQDYADQAKADAIEAASTADRQVRKDFKETTDALSSTISQNKSDADGKISTAQTTATQALDGLETKVSQTDYDKKTGDLSTAVNTVTQTATETKNELANVSKTVDSQSAKINTISNTVDGTTQTISDIQTEQGKQSGSIATLQSRADGFEATVTKVNNLSVGGRNYVQNSSGLNGSSTVRPTLIGASSSTSNATVTYPSDGILMTNGDTNTTTEWYYQVASVWTKFSDTPLTPGKQITFSADAMGTVPQAVLRYGFNGGTGGKESYKSFDINNTSWTRVSITVTSTSTNTGLYFRIQGGINNQYVNGWTGGETLKFRYVKIEDGNTPTAWSPAPEDLSSATAKAQLTADKANLDLSTYKSDANGRISKAQSDITATSKEVSTKVSQSDFNAKTDDLTTKYGQVKATADSVTTDVAKYKKSNDGKVSANTANINTLSGLIDSKVSKTDFDSVTGDLSGKYTETKQTVDSMSQTVTELQAKANAQGQINQLVNTEFSPDFAGWYAGQSVEVVGEKFNTSPLISASTGWSLAGVKYNGSNVLRKTVRIGGGLHSDLIQVQSGSQISMSMAYYNSSDYDGNVPMAFYVRFYDADKKYISAAYFNHYTSPSFKVGTLTVNVPSNAVYVSLNMVYNGNTGTIYYSQPMLVFSETIGDYVAGNYNNNARVAELELGVDHITGLVSDPKNGLSATATLASNGLSVATEAKTAASTADGKAVDAQKLATTANTTANGVQTTVTSVQKDVKDLQSTTTQTASQVTTEIEDRKNGDNNTLTQAKNFTSSSITSSEKNMRSEIQQSADGIVAQIQNNNLVPNSEFEPKNKGWRKFTNSIGATPGDIVTLNGTSSFIDWPLKGNSNGIVYTDTQWIVSEPSIVNGSVVSASIVAGRRVSTIGNITQALDIRIAYFDKDKKLIGSNSFGNPIDGNTYKGLQLYKLENMIPTAGTRYVGLVIAHSGPADDVIFRPMLNYGKIASVYQPTYATTSTSTALELFDGRFALGIKDNAGNIISGINGDTSGPVIQGKKLVINPDTTFNPDYSCTKFLTTAKSVKYNKLP